MLTYLSETLGFPANERLWESETNLPLYLRSGREYSVLTINDSEMLAVRMDAGSFSLPAFQKQLARLREFWDGSVVLVFRSLTSYQRKALISNNIPFIVPGSQIYMPFLGTMLQERMPAGEKGIEKFTPATQAVFLHLLYFEREVHPSKAEIARALDTSAMNVTRAIQGLQELGLVSVERSGRSDYVSALLHGKALYEAARKHLINPIRKRIFVADCDEVTSLPICGETALSAHSMLAQPSTPCHAIGGEEFKKLASVEIIDPAWHTGPDYIELEIWKYDPCLFATNGTVDVVSLVESLSDSNDERVTRAVEMMLEEWKW